MHLLNTSTRKIQDFPYGNVPPYVILSHRWEEEEVSYKDLTEPKKDPQSLKGWTKLDSFCSLVKQDGWEWVWMDTCCIDKSSSAELSEAINSMYRWYGEAGFCIVYLADISVLKDETGKRRKQFHQSEWFERGWTLQELLAPGQVVFYDKNWESIGTKTSLEVHVSRATHISSKHLSEPLEASVAAKMSWASERETSRPEDIAYSLLGLFEVNMPLLYGEGELKAFQRLQYEILRSARDESIYAWICTPYDNFSPFNRPGLLAPSPRRFSQSGDIVPIEPFDSQSANLHAPQILFDGLVWTLERSFTRDNDPMLDNVLWSYESAYITPLICSKDSNRYAPVKLRMVMTEGRAPYQAPRRAPHYSLEFFSENEMQELRNSKAQVQSYRLIQAQPRDIFSRTSRTRLRRGFTLRLSTSAQYQCSTPSTYGSGIELHNNRESGEYIVSVSGESRKIAGIKMQHKRGAIIKVACEPETSDLWWLVMKINKMISKIELEHFHIFNLHGSPNLRDSALVSLEQGQSISVSPKHGLRADEYEVVVHIDCNMGKTIDLEGILGGDSDEAKIDYTDASNMSTSSDSD